MDGGAIIAKVLVNHDVKFLFTLCGGHISPILTGAKALGIRVVDTRDEKNAVFAADAISRITGKIGVVAVTAGPGVTNTITAIKNAQLAQSPLLLLGGAAATILKGRGSLQDIEQLKLLKTACKKVYTISKIKDAANIVNDAIYEAKKGVPGPVFVECPVDLLYEESIVRSWYQKQGTKENPSLKEKFVTWHIDNHLNKLFKDAGSVEIPQPKEIKIKRHSDSHVQKALQMLRGANKPVMVIGSQMMFLPEEIKATQRGLESLGIPMFLSGAARGFLGKDHPLQIRHKRRDALKKADLIFLIGVPFDFRMNYGLSVPGKTPIISINFSKEDLNKNRKPTLGILAAPGKFLVELATEARGLKISAKDYQPFVESLKDIDRERETEIQKMAAQKADPVNPLSILIDLEKVLDKNSVLVADGGDFVASAAYTLQPRSPYAWLDPGVFGTLGVGGGFALGAKLARPDAEVWIIYGDGSSAFSLAEFDSFVRHKTPVIALVGNDACWTQIKRDQVEILHDDVGTPLLRTDYHIVAKGYGGEGLLLDDASKATEIFQQAQQLAREGKSVLINAIIGTTDFRKGSISM